MILSEAAEEILEALWISQEEKGAHDTDPAGIRVENKESGLEELLKAGCVLLENGRLRLLERGREYGRSMVRRHRLAERLMVDVLQLKTGLVNKTACRLEHILHPEVEESVCTLLGHPKVCPHGKAIPHGKCCQESKWMVESGVKPLTALAAGQKGRVAYIHTGNNKKLQKLMAMGVLPGMSILLLHRTPSYVFQIGHTQVAVDGEMACDIYVRIARK